jgi:hypothetical protein
MNGYLKKGVRSLLSHKDEFAGHGLKRWRNVPVFLRIWDIARWALLFRPLGGLLHC